jgi:hypothetical protein
MLTPGDDAMTDQETAVLKAAYKYADKLREIRERSEIAGAVLPAYHAIMTDLLGAAADLLSPTP